MIKVEAKFTGTIGELIRAARARKQETQKQTSVASGISVPTLKKVEEDRPVNASSCFGLFKHFDVSLMYKFGSEPVTVSDPYNSSTVISELREHRAMDAERLALAANVDITTVMGDDLRWGAFVQILDALEIDLFILLK